MSMYRTPIVTGDRVALAPHTDLWMQGARFGRCEDIVINEEGYLRYLVDVSLPGEQTGVMVWLDHDDLMGAVAGTPVGGHDSRRETVANTEGAVPAPHGVPLCGHSDHLMREET